nr:reverse transcriptase domain-containing protein [Tanacetum cinerariifolium]
MPQKVSEEDKETEVEETRSKELRPENAWKLFTDGASSFDGSGAGLIVGNTPSDPQKSRKLRIKAPQYIMIDDKLYRKSYLSPWLRCVGPVQAKSIIQEIQQGSCRMHPGPRMLDQLILIKKAKAGDNTYNLSMAFLLVGIDIVGPLPIAPGDLEYPRKSSSIMEVVHRRTIPCFWPKARHTPSLHLSLSPPSKWDFDVKQNEKRRRENLNIVKERRDIALIREAYYKQKLEGYYNKRVWPSTFNPGTYVLRVNSASKAKFQGKIRPTWEGPYIIKKAYGDGPYKLETVSGSLIDRTWNG